MTDRPIVSVLMLAYRHGRYIRQAVESVLAQKTEFPFEIVIGEDCSPDDTRAILLQLERSHPGRLHLRLHPHNLGAGGNLTDTFAACRGEFIAVLEGDDYWTCEQKLQRQVEFLRKHPECALCYHNVHLIDEVSGRDPLLFFRSPQPSYLTTRDLLANNFVPTCSVMYRRSALPAEFPPEIAKLPMQDWPTWMRVSRSGALGYLDEVMACYRVHSGGAWTQLNAERQLAWHSLFFAHVADQYPDLAEAAHVEHARRRQHTAAKCLELGLRCAALRILARAAAQRQIQPGFFWLMAEGLCGRVCTTYAKRAYRRLRGLPPMPAEVS